MCMSACWGLLFYRIHDNWTTWLPVSEDNKTSLHISIIRLTDQNRIGTKPITMGILVWKCKLRLKHCWRYILEKSDFLINMEIWTPNQCRLIKLYPHCNYSERISMACQYQRFNVIPYPGVSNQKGIPSWQGTGDSQEIAATPRHANVDPRNIIKCPWHFWMYCDSILFLSSLIQSSTFRRFGGGSRALMAECGDRFAQDDKGWFPKSKKWFPNSKVCQEPALWRNFREWMHVCTCSGSHPIKTPVDPLARFEVRSILKMIPTDFCLFFMARKTWNLLGFFLHLESYELSTNTSFDKYH